MRTVVSTRGRAREGVVGYPAQLFCRRPGRAFSSTALKSRGARMRKRMFNTAVDGWDVTTLHGQHAVEPIDFDAHALQVSATTQYLQQHLDRLRIGQATHDECRAVAAIIRAAHAAQRTAP
jgi:hypothetical protein